MQKFYPSFCSNTNKTFEKTVWERDLIKIFNHIGLKWTYKNVVIPSYQSEHIPSFLVKKLDGFEIIDVHDFSNFEFFSDLKVISIILDNIKNYSYLIFDSDLIKVLIDYYFDKIPGLETAPFEFIDHRIPVVGIEIGKRKIYLETVKNGDELKLVAEKNNSFDKFAIKVLNKDGHQIGYVKKEYAALLRNKMNLGFAYKCNLVVKNFRNNFLEVTVVVHPTKGKRKLQDLNCSFLG